MNADLLAIQPPAWMDHPYRNCAVTTEPDLWFPRLRADTLYAAHLCRDCPVIDACRDYAQADHTLEGIWGGTTQGQRAAARTGRLCGCGEICAPRRRKCTACADKAAAESKRRRDRERLARKRAAA